MSPRDPTAAPGRQRTSYGAIVSTAGAGIFIASGYVVNVWLGRLLGPEDFGRFGIVVSLITVLNIVQRTAIPQAVARSTAQAPDSAEGTLRRGVELQIALSLALAAALALGATTIAEALDDPELVGLLWLAAPVLPAYGLLTLLIAFHIGQRSYTRQAVTSTAYSVAKAVGSIGLAYGYNVAGAVVGYGVAAVVGVVAGWHRLWAPRSTDSFRRLLAFAAPLTVYAIAATAQWSIDIFFVQAMLTNPEETGFYAASQSIARIPVHVMAGLAAMILPAVAGAAHHDEAVSRMTRGALRWTIRIVVPAVAIIMVTASPLVELLYSRRYSPAAGILVLLAPAMGALAVSSVAAAVLNGLGRPTASAVLAILGVVATILGCLLLIPRAGVHGAAAATLVGSLIPLVGLLALLWNSFPGSVPLSTLARTCGVGVSVALAARLLPAGGVRLLAVYALLGGLTVGLLLITREVTLGELRRLVDDMRDSLR
jgi:stage V sporulation protein B